MFKSYHHYWSSTSSVISSIWFRLTKNVMRLQAQDNKVDLNQLLSGLNEENKHSLIFCDSCKNLDHSTPKEEASFSIQISVESHEQLKRRWAKEMKFLDSGIFSEPSKRLSFETWDDFFDIFSDKGKAMIEELRKG